MAHMVKYWTSEGDRLTPTVSSPVSAQAHTSPADVMLVSGLLNMYYGMIQVLPPGARHLIKPSGAFTAETKVFILDFQSRLSRLRADGRVSVVPIGHNETQLQSYTMFNLFRLVARLTSWDDGDDMVLEALKTMPHLQNLDSMIQGAPLPPAPSEEGSGIVSGATGSWSAQGL
jgi:hypothetical protein